MKSKWESKTWWSGLTISLIGTAGFFFEPLKAFLADNAEGITTGVGVLFTFLRTITTKPIE